jgi:hypothetical protein
MNKTLWAALALRSKLALNSRSVSAVLAKRLESKENLRCLIYCHLGDRSEQSQAIPDQSGTAAILLRRVAQIPANRPPKPPKQ